MLLKDLVIDNKSDLEFVEKLYIESFPRNERRPIAKMHDLIKHNSKFKLALLIENDTRVGFISFWTFDKFVYGEHFAINPECRNGGYGKTSIEAFIALAKNLPIILEVELPKTEIAKRRIGFYERNGFKSLDIPYEQPPYEVGYDAIPMQLMTYGNIDQHIDFDTIKEIIYREVYKVK